MTITITTTHQKVSAIADDPASALAGEVLPSDWNADHTASIQMASGKFLGRSSSGDGPVEELDLAGNWVQIGNKVVVAGSETTIDFTGFDPTKFEIYRLWFWKLRFALDNILCLRTSPDGVDFDDGPTDYLSLFETTGSGFPAFQVQNAWDSYSEGYVDGGSSMLASTTFPANGHLTIYNPQDSSEKCFIETQIVFDSLELGKVITTKGAIWRQSAAAVEGIRLFPYAPDTFATGEFLFTGMRK